LEALRYRFISRARLTRHPFVPSGLDRRIEFHPPIGASTHNDSAGSKDSPDAECPDRFPPDRCAPQLALPAVTSHATRHVFGANVAVICSRFPPACRRATLAREELTRAVGVLIKGMCMPRAIRDVPTNGPFASLQLNNREKGGIIQKQNCKDRLDGASTPSFRPAPNRGP
jgi:hypothetical protein